jgi:hypothetical protein
LKSVFCFDEALNFVGSEDVLFFREVYRKNFKIKFCSTAIVFDHVVEERMCLNWVLKRRFRSSLPVDLMINQKSNRSNFILKMNLIMHSVFFIALLVCFSPLIILKIIPSKGHLLLGRFVGPKIGLLLRRINNGYRGVAWFLASRLGVLGGVFGFRYQEYAHPTVELKNGK